MLRTWNVENINQGQRALGGGSKARKALGDAGPVSENPPPAAKGKGALLSDPKGGNRQQRRPLGGRSENVLASSSSSSSSGKGGRRVPDSKPKQQQQQRRALVDISNAGNGPAGAGAGNGGTKLSSGKKSASGLKFSVHSDPWKQGAVGTGKVSGSTTTTGGGGGGGGIASKQAKVGVEVAGGEDEGFAKKHAFFVEDIEVTMGRTGDEEEVLVQRRAEERAARSTNPFKTATVLSLQPRKPSIPVSVSSGAPIGAVGTMETPGGAAAPRDAVAGPSPSSPPSPLLSALGPDDGLQITIDRRLHDNHLEDTGMLRLANDVKGQGGLDFLADEDLEPDWLTIPTDDLNSTPLSPLSDSFLTQELELTFK